MVDVSHRVAVIFEHPKSTKKDPKIIGVTFKYLLENGPPLTDKGKVWHYKSVELLQ